MGDVENRKRSNKNNYKWYFVDAAALNTAYPIWQSGRYVIIWTTDTIWVRDEDTSTWVDSYKFIDISGKLDLDQTEAQQFTWWALTGTWFMRVIAWVLWLDESILYDGNNWIIVKNNSQFYTTPVTAAVVVDDFVLGGVFSWSENDNYEIEIVSISDNYISPITFFGTLDDANIDTSAISRTTNNTYLIEIDSIDADTSLGYDTFSFSDLHSGLIYSNVAIDGTVQTLPDWMTVQFWNITGHALGDKWSFEFQWGNWVGYDMFTLSKSSGVVSTMNIDLTEQTLIDGFTWTFSNLTGHRNGDKWTWAVTQPDIMKWKLYDDTIIAKIGADWFLKYITNPTFTQDTQIVTKKFVEDCINAIVIPTTYVEDTNENIIALAVENQLVPTAWYYSTDDFYLLQAVVNNNFSRKGYAKFQNTDFERNGDYSQVSLITSIWTYLGTWNNWLIVTRWDIVYDDLSFQWFVNLTDINTSTNPVSDWLNWATVNQGVWFAYMESSLKKNMVVIWKGRHYVVYQNLALDWSDPDQNTSAYTRLEYENGVGYITEWDNVGFDFDLIHGLIDCREDVRKNSVCSYIAINNFQWGNRSVVNNKVLGWIIICMNNNGSIEENNLSMESSINAISNTGSISQNDLSMTASIDANENAWDIIGNMLSDNAVVNGYANTGDISLNTILSDGNIAGNNNSWIISSNFIYWVGTLFSANNAWTIQYNRVSSNMSIYLELESGYTVSNCIFDLPNTELRLPSNQNFVNQIINKKWSSFVMDLDASACYAGWVLTIPDDMEFVWTFNLINYAGGDISNIVGWISRIFPVKFICSNGIGNTFTPITIASATTGDIVSSGSSETIVGRTNGSDFFEIQSDWNLFVRKSSAVIA